MLKIDFQDINKAKALLEEMAPIFSQNADIHRYTRILGKHSILFNQLDVKYQLSQKAEFDTISAEILAFSKNDSQVRTVLNSIKNLNRNEPETGLNVQEMLIKTWNLAGRTYSNAKDLVLDNLKHNIMTNGGCLAGISARLIQPYSHFIMHSLEKRLSPCEEDDPDLVLALIKSMSEQSEHEKLEEEDLEMAIALSLSMQKDESVEQKSQNIEKKPRKKWSI